MLTVTPTRGLPSSPVTLPDTGTLCALTENEEARKRRIMQFWKRAASLVFRQRGSLAGRFGSETLDLRLVIFIFLQFCFKVIMPGILNLVPFSGSGNSGGVIDTEAIIKDFKFIKTTFIWRKKVF
jgi:hypothetical protein